MMVTRKPPETRDPDQSAQARRGTDASPVPSSTNSGADDHPVASTESAKASTHPPRHIVCLLAEERAQQVAAMIASLSRESGIEVQIERVSDLKSLDPGRCEHTDTLILVDSRLLTQASHGIDEFTRIPMSSARTMVLLDDWPDMDLLTDFVLHGISGCMLLSSPPSFFRRAMGAMSNGELWFPRRTMSDAVQRLLEQAGHISALEGSSLPPGGSCGVQQLTERERTIVSLLRAGLTNKEIGKKLGISNETVKKHLGRVFRRLGVRNRIQLVLEARPRGAG